jgi:hypothetical protein
MGIRPSNFAFAPEHRNVTRSLFKQGRVLFVHSILHRSSFGTVAFIPNKCAFGQFRLSQLTQGCGYRMSFLGVGNESDFFFIAGTTKVEVSENAQEERVRQLALVIEIELRAK